jgi:SET domain-containing protein
VTRLVEVRRIPGKGRGVVALVDLPEGTLVEESPVQPVSATEAAVIEASAPSVAQHLFWWDDDGREAVVFGIGTMFNHSPDGCLRLTRDYASDVIRFFLKRAVSAGEELCYDYGCPLWFTPA